MSKSADQMAFNNALYREYGSELMNYAKKLYFQDLIGRKRLIYEWVKTHQLSLSQYCVLSHDFIESEIFRSKLSEFPQPLT